MCECHPRSKEDEAIWRKVKAEPPTREEWAALHDLIERYQRLRIQNFKARGKPASAGAVDPSAADPGTLPTREKSS